MTRHLNGYVGALLATGGALVAYRAGRTHAAWREVRSARYSARPGRKLAWSHSARLAAGVAVIIAGLLMAGFEMSR
ncbi:hypothetical protein AB0M02_05750 [Actinoplanes sp. NPDC051861]|uniref:hypothetical protein n=1 Tax=Actinoplanes sp. NPDC051861 TaxID=3155170 RepID=UPI00343E03A0